MNMNMNRPMTPNELRKLNISPGIIDSVNLVLSSKIHNSNGRIVVTMEELSECLNKHYPFIDARNELVYRPTPEKIKACFEEYGWFVKINYMETTSGLFKKLDSMEFIELPDKCLK